MGDKNVEQRRNVETHLALWNAVNVGAAQPLEQILDDRQADSAALRVAMPQTTIRGEECMFEPEAMLGAFTSCLRYASHCTATATDLTPAAPWQVEHSAADLQS